MHVGVVVNALLCFLLMPLPFQLSGNSLEVLNFRRLLNDWEVVRVTKFFKVLEIFKGTTDNEDFMIWNSNVRRATQLIQHTTY